MLIDFVKAREGLATDNHDGTVTAYWDSDGKVWTIGYGTTGPEVAEGLTWTYEQCDKELQVRLVRARGSVCVLTPPTTQWPEGALDALTDFVYNVGAGHYQGSTLRKCVLAGDWAGAKAHLLDWEYAGGKKLAGLMKRREGEAAMIQTPTKI